MDIEFTPKELSKWFKLLLYLCIALVIYSIIEPVMLSIETTHWSNVRLSFNRQVLITAFINTFILSSGLNLSQSKKYDNDRDLGYKYNEEARRFGASILSVSIIIYLLIVISIVSAIIHN